MVAGAKIEIRNDGRGSPRLHSPQRPEIIPADPINPKGVRLTAALETPFETVELRDHDSAHLRGRLVAFPHDYFSVVDDSGRFEISGVPAGAWTVKLWYRDGWLELDERLVIDVPAAKNSPPLTIPLPRGLETTPPPKPEH